MNNRVYNRIYLALSVTRNFKTCTINKYAAVSQRKENINKTLSSHCVPYTVRNDRKDNWIFVAYAVRDVTIAFPDAVYQRPAFWSATDLSLAAR